MTHPLRGAAAIVGVADETSPTGEIDEPLRALEARVIKAALDDAGIAPGEVDGLCSCTGGTLMHSVELAEHLGLRPSWTDSTQIGGASYELFVEHATAAIAAGLCETVVISYASTPRASRKRGAGGLGVLATPERIEWEMPYGLLLPIGAYALAASRHMALYGTTSEQLAQIAVDTRAWAVANPRAYLRDPISVADVLDSGFVAEPLHKLDCCLVTDGAAALVVTSAARARDSAKPPAWILGVGTHHTHSMVSQMPDLTVTPGVQSGARAFAMAGLGPDEMDVVELYDSFTITVLLALEDLGFCKKGEYKDLAKGGRFRFDNALKPTLNTDGGGLSSNHPGMRGIFLLFESVRQLRGESTSQVPNAQLAIAHGNGGALGGTHAGGSVILARD